MSSSTLLAWTETHSKVRKVDHANGLVELENALWEYINEKTLSSVLEYHASQHPNDPEQAFTTVGIYAVLSLGFEYGWEANEIGDWRYYSAGAIARQASRRHPGPFGFITPDEGVLLEQNHECLRNAQ